MARSLRRAVPQNNSSTRSSVVDSTELERARAAAAAMAADEPVQVKLISKRQLLAKVPMSYPAVWQAMRDGRFPRSRAAGGRVFWVESEVDAWINGLPFQVLKGDAPDQQSAD
jgi:predicted DNA-binding transcriptional regulator AlpA